MTCNFTPFSTVHVFPSFQGDGWVIMNSCMQFLKTSFAIPFAPLTSKIPSKTGSALKERNLLLEEQVLSFKSSLLLRREAK